MRKLFYIVVLSLLVVSAFGQNPGALKFLGIPIDGPKAQFVAALKAKGYYYNSLSEVYEGQFNGQPVNVYVHTNHNLVDRVYVAFPLTNEDGIRVEFNRLLAQFKASGKYMDLVMNEEIPADDDISYEITVHNKRYQASFSYFDPDRDPVAFTDALLDKFSDFFTAEQLRSLKAYCKKLIDAPNFQTEDIQAEMMAEMQRLGFVTEENDEANTERAWQFLVTYLEGMKSLADGDVWFMIHESYGRYRIGLYYDNLHNQAHGEDL